MTGEITPVAEAVSGLAKVAYELLHKTQRELIDEAFAQSRIDTKKFLRALLDMVDGQPDAPARLQLMLDGLVRLVPVDISPADMERLSILPVGNRLDLYDLLGLYAIGRGAAFSQRVNQILQTQPNN